MNKIKLIITTIAFLSASLFAPLAITSVSMAAVQYTPGKGACSGSNGGVPGEIQDCPSDSGSNLPNIVKNIINWFSWIVGAISVIMIIYGGFRYITSGGDQNGVTAAKNTLLYAVVGLIVVALSQIIVNFVLGAANNAKNA